jgi:acetyl esterase
MSDKSFSLPGLNHAARQKLLAIGQVWNDDIVGHRQQIVDLYSPLVANAAAGLYKSSDVAYGRHDRHKVDIFRTSDSAVKPIVIFVHGGAFTRGAKSVNGAIYDNLPAWFAWHGFVAFNMEYRLAPEARYPAGALDLRDCVDWIGENAEAHGGDPSRIVLIGHSAGGAHVATYMLDPVMQAAPSANVCGIVLLSARLRADTRPENPNARNVEAYFGDDQALFAERSPVSHAARCRVPVFIGIAEYENRLLDQYGLEFALDVARASGRMPRIVQCRHHNHTSIVAHFGTPDEGLGHEILDFIRTECLSGPQAEMEQP